MQDIFGLKPNNIIGVLEKRKYEFALKNEKRFKKALIYDGLLTKDLNPDYESKQVTCNSKRHWMYFFRRDELEKYGIVFDVPDFSIRDITPDSEKEDDKFD